VAGGCRKEKLPVMVITQVQRDSRSLCTAAGETKRKQSHVLTLVISGAMQTMAWKDLS